MILLVALAWVSIDCRVAIAEHPDEDSTAKKDLHLFLLVGQSNMAGRGKLTPTDKIAHPRVWMLGKDHRWTPAIDPMHFDKPVAGVGLGRTFGICIADADSEIHVGLIPCAVGGSPIDSWEPGGYHHQTKSHPYGDALMRAKIALKSGTLKGILWHQGESDSKPILAEAYELKLHTLIDRFRRDLQATDVPFIAGQMGQFDERPWSDEKKRVDAAHRGLPDRIPFTAFVASDGLAHGGDEVHFSADCYREFGRRFANAYHRLTGRSRP
ncbi:MAG: sialate O-acetylesterase [Planctomycetota bacterium]